MFGRSFNSPLEQPHFRLKIQVEELSARFIAVHRAKLFINVVKMDMHGGRRNFKQAGYVLVTAVGADLEHDLLLPRG
jgi:hypothetical protein